MRFTLPLVRVLGIPIRLSLSWFLTLGFVTVLLAVSVYPEWLPDQTSSVHWLLGLGSGLLFFASILVHELAHSLVARAYGIPVRSITLFIFGGVAHITREAKRPFAEFAMALAGPASSVLLAGLFLLLWWALGGGEDDPVTVMWEWLLLMNLGVAMFNMAPGFPLDGGRVLRSVLWGVTGDFRRATFLSCWCGRIIAYALVGLGIAGAIGVFGWLSPGAGLWFVLIGVFLEGAARNSWIQLKAIEFLRGYSAADVMSRDLPVVVGELTLEEVMGESAAELKRACLFVTSADRVAGILTIDQVHAVPRARWATTTALAAARASEQVRVASPTTDAATLLQTMEAEEVRFLPVVEEGRLLGVVSREEIVRLLIVNRVLR